MTRIYAFRSQSQFGRVCELIRVSRSIVLATGVALAAAASAHAQGIPVIDATAVAKHLEQISELQKQLQEARKIYDTANQLKESMNGITDIKDVAGLLNNSEFQQYLPQEYSQYSGAVNDLINGNVGGFAKQYDYYQREGNSPANDFYYNELNRRKDETYKDMAVGEAVYNQASRRAEGLNELKDKLASASTPKEVLDLQARISAESAFLQNDINRMQGLAMIQQARNRVDEQREDEKIQQMNDQIEKALNGNG